MVLSTPWPSVDMVVTLEPSRPKKGLLAHGGGKR
jgi:hypothetical protein